MALSAFGQTARVGKDMVLSGGQYVCAVQRAGGVCLSWWLRLDESVNDCGDYKHISFDVREYAGAFNIYVSLLACWESLCYHNSRNANIRR